MTGRRLSFPQDTSYMSFPNTPQQISEQAVLREEAGRRTTEVMRPYDEEFLAVEGRREVLDTVAKADHNVAINVISNLSEVKRSKMEIDEESEAKVGGATILLRLNVVQNISVKTEEKKPAVPSLTDIIASSPDGKFIVKRSKRLQEKEKPYDR